MKHNFLEILQCPDCKGCLELSIFREEHFLCKEIMEGILLCPNCKKSFPVIEGIPRFVPNTRSIFLEFFKKYPQLLKEIGEEKEFEKVHGDTQRKFGLEWLNYPGSLPEDQKIFLEETQIPEEEWKLRRILDAGCGMGRYSRAAHYLGAEVVALDLGPALIRLWDLAVKSERLHLVQGNLLSIPLKPKSFDIVYSLGVVHHTPSAEQSVKNLSQLVKPQGQMSVWVYGTNGTYKNFKTNPLRSDRQGLKKMIFLVWMIVTIREFISNSLRRFTIHIPQNLLYALCYPLALIGKIPLIQYLTFSVHPLWRVRLQENFDWLSPPYQSHHTKEELSQWFEKCGFKVLKILPHGFVPKPGVLGVKIDDSFTIRAIRLFLILFTFFMHSNLVACSPGSFYTDGNKNKKAIALTFDDGPGEWTLKVLDILDQYKIKATFFMNGDQVELRPQLAKEVLNRGHQIGDHTYSHINFYVYEKKFGLEKTKLKIKEEIQKSRDLIIKATGKPPEICRMPHGYHRAWMKEIAKEFNLCLVNWTFGKDWLKISEDRLLKEYVQNLRPGAILLFHDGGRHREKTLNLFPRIIEEAKKKGFSIVTVSQILE